MGGRVEGLATEGACDMGGRGVEARGANRELVGA